MEYVDPKELGDVVTFCFSYFFTSSLPLIMFLFFFWRGRSTPDNLFGGVCFFFPLSFPLLFALISDFFLLFFPLCLFPHTSFCSSFKYGWICKTQSWRRSHCNRSNLLSVLTEKGEKPDSSSQASGLQRESALPINGWEEWTFYISGKKSWIL